MDIHNIRLQLRQKTIYEVPLRVTFYARVSTDSQEQLNSLTNQISYYEEMIKKNSAWTYVPGYIDEGLSGISTKKREHFHRMIDDAKAGKFDLILTKEISRFARNTLDSIQYTRDLLNAGVAVFFQNDNIKTIDEDSELRLSIMSSIAQDELRKLSSRVKFGHQQAIKEGVVLGNNRIFGYIKDDGRLVIDETEAPMVRQLFELYATGEYSMKQIEKIFWDQGYRNYRGNRIAHTTMSNMISNPKYKGYYVGNKVKVIDMFTKKQKFLPPEEWVMFKDETGEIVPAIVSEELWDQANAVLRRRSEDVKNRQNVCNSENLLTSKLYCTCCGTPYYRKESKSRKGVPGSKWICSGKIKNGAHTCDSIPLYESELKPILLEVFQDTKVDTEALIAKYSAMHAELAGNAVLQKEIASQKQIIELEQQKKSKLLGYNVSGRISDRDFIAMTDQCNADIQKAEEALRELEEQMQSNEEFQKHMAKIRAVMREAQKCVESGFITKAFVDQYIDKIFATPEADGTVRLDIRIFTGEATEKYLEKLKVRSGQMNHPIDRPEESPTAATTLGDGVHPGHMSKIVFEAGYTMMNIGMGSLLGNMAKNDSERATLASARGFGSTLGGFVGGALIPLCLGKFGMGNDGYAKTAVVMAIPMVILVFLHYALTEERNKSAAAAVEKTQEEKDAEKFKISDIWNIITKNRAFLALVLHSICICAVQALGQGAATYMFADVLKNISVQSLGSTLSTATMVIILLAAPIMTKKWDLVLIIRVCLIAGFISYAGLLAYTLLIPTANINPFLYVVWNGISGALVQMSVQMQWGLVAESIDYNEYLTGKRNEGTIYGFFSLSRRIGSTIANSASVLIISAIGYDAALTNAGLDQSDATIMGIKLMVVGFPMVAALGSWSCFTFIWNINKDVRAKMAAWKAAK